MLISSAPRPAHEAAGHIVDIPRQRTGIRLSYPSVDDCLGPGQDRYFGSGYRRSGYTVDGARVEHVGGSTRLRAHAAVRYAPDWSRKAAEAARPHLSTIDALLLGFRASEVCAANRIGTTHRQRSTCWPRRVDIRAAGAPVESALDAVDIDARVRDTTSDRHGHVSLVDCGIASLRSRWELVHPHDQRTTGPAPAGPVPERLLDDRYPGVYGRGFLNHRQAVYDLELDLDAASARAVVVLGTSVVPIRGGGPRTLGRPATMIDAFVVALQMGQALLYELDGMTRAESDTLWMRRTVMAADEPGVCHDRPTRASAVLRDVELVRVRGDRWRCAVIDARFAGVRTRCSVAHRLPTGTGSTARPGAVPA